MEANAKHYLALSDDNAWYLSYRSIYCALAKTIKCALDGEGKQSREFIGSRQPIGQDKFQEEQLPGMCCLTPDTRLSTAWGWKCCDGEELQVCARAEAQLAHGIPGVDGGEAALAGSGRIKLKQTNHKPLHSSDACTWLSQYLPLFHA
eukprot:5677743-Amphidinium_carterae.1